jgi:hypothetical protein
VETYRKTFAPDTTLILSTDGEFFRFLKESKLCAVLRRDLVTS